MKNGEFYYATYVDGNRYLCAFNAYTNRLYVVNDDTIKSVDAALCTDVFLVVDPYDLREQ
jgi:hypothetical protein